MRCLLLGGTGFIGPYVVRRLCDWEHEVTIFHRGSTISDMPPSVETVLGDLRNIDAHLHELLKPPPDVMLYTHPIGQDDVENILSRFAGKIGRIVLLSSQDVYRAYGVLIGLEKGPLQELPIKERDDLRTSLYPYRKDADGVASPNNRVGAILHLRKP